jgi:hypothetical protein
MACASPQVKQTAGSMRYLVSPFFDLGWAAVAAGNIGVSLAAPLLHSVGGFSLWLLRRAPSVPDALVKAQFPSLSFAVASFLFQGACQGSFTLLATGAGAEKMLGAMGAAYGLAFLAGAQYVVLRRTMALRFFPYDFKRTAHPAMLWLLPVGRWGPPPPRSAFGRYVSTVRSEHKVVAAAPLLQAALVSLLSAFSVSRTACVVLWGLLTAVYSALVGLYAYIAPMRVPAWSAAQALMTAALGAITLVNALAEGGVASDALRVQMTAVMTVALTVLSGILSLHMIAVNVLELRGVWPDPSLGRSAMRRRWRSRAKSIVDRHRAVESAALATREALAWRTPPGTRAEQERRMRVLTNIAALTGQSHRARINRAADGTHQDLPPGIDDASARETPDVVR